MNEKYHFDFFFLTSSWPYNIRGCNLSYFPTSDTYVRQCLQKNVISSYYWYSTYECLCLRQRLFSCQYLGLVYQDHQICYIKVSICNTLKRKNSNFNAPSKPTSCVTVKVGRATLAETKIKQYLLVNEFCQFGLMQ